MRKRAAILEAAATAFRVNGFGASMEDIACRAGVAKQTVYNHFKSKAELIHALAEDISRSIAVDLQPGEDECAERTLTGYGEIFLAHLLNPDTAQMHRLVLSQADGFPDLAADIYDLGPRQRRACLAAWLERETAAGRLHVSDPDAAAEIFFGMLTGQRLLCAMLKPKRPFGEEDVGRRVRECVRVFLSAYSVTGRK